ncbi:MAG: YtxH domain-containing protein [Balneolaceae bacterium]|nr:YtxH domain-containing protein [Balneolaceae bacterium]
MSKQSHIGLFLLAASSFISGVGLGMLLAPKSGKRNREWISNHASELAHWMEEKGRDTVKRSEERLHHLRSRVERGYSRNIPDLYEATQHIDLDGSELVDE